MKKQVISFYKDETEANNVNMGSNCNFSDYNKEAIQKCYSAIYDYVWGLHSNQFFDEEEFEKEMEIYSKLHYLVDKQKIALPRKLYDNTMEYMEKNFKPIKMSKELSDEMQRIVKSDRKEDEDVRFPITDFIEFAEDNFYPAMFGVNIEV